MGKRGRGYGYCQVILPLMLQGIVPSRQRVQDVARRLGKPCLHVGVNADYAEVIWDEEYRVPREAGQDVCDYPLARNLVLLAVAVASESLVSFVLEGARRNWSVTLRDLRISGFGE